MVENRPNRSYERESVSSANLLYNVYVDHSDKKNLEASFYCTVGTYCTITGEEEIKRGNIRKSFTVSNNKEI